MFTIDEIIKATDATLIGKKPQGQFFISTDSRNIKKNDIYLPLKGENFDGEDFITSAIESDAAGSFFSKKHIESISSDKFFLKVNNTLEAYLKLAQFYKNKIAPKTIAITGSSGKTTTKEMVYTVISQKYKTHKTEKNFNNEIGFCKTLLSMPEDTEVLIIEMGMRGFGEIELLSRYATPNIAIITNAGTAHIGRLGSKENIAKAKCEIISHLMPDGTLIAHDNQLIKDNIQNLNKKIYFTLSDTNILERKIGCTKFTYKSNEYTLNIEGDYNVQNALCAIEAGILLKLTPQEIAKGLNNYTPIEKRWDIQEIKGYKIINDSYNANPDSMKAAIKTVADTYKNPIIILGDMGELGENEIKYHQEIGDFICNQKNKLNIFSVGKLANEITKRLLKKGIPSKNFENNQQISKYILANVNVGTTIVLKASRSMKFEEIIENINKEKG